MSEYQAKIERVFSGLEDHGIHTVTIELRGDDWGQTFGNLCMRDELESADFLRSVAAVFGVNPDELEGQECEVLRAFRRGQIEGLRSIATGRVFTLRAWHRKRGYPAPTPLEEAYANHRLDIERARRLLEALEREDPAHGYTPVPDGEAP